MRLRRDTITSCSSFIQNGVDEECRARKPQQLCTQTCTRSVQEGSRRVCLCVYGVKTHKCAEITKHTRTINISGRDVGNMQICTSECAPSSLFLLRRHLTFIDFLCTSNTARNIFSFTSTVLLIFFFLKISCWTQSHFKCCLEMAGSD